VVEPPEEVAAKDKSLKKEEDPQEGGESPEVKL